MNDDTAAQHVREPCDRFAVSVTVLERLREMFRYQESKVCILRLQFLRIKTVTVDRYDAVCILINNVTVRVHAESPHEILELLGPVHDLALVQLTRQM